MSQKQKPWVLILAGVGALALLGGGGWAGYRVYDFRQQKATLAEYLDLLCTTLAVRTVIELKHGIEISNSMNERAGMKTIGGSHVVTTPELDAEIEKVFAGRDFYEKNMGADPADAEKLKPLIAMMKTKAPESEAQCASLRRAMDNCMPSFPYTSSEPSPDCKDKYVGPVTKTITEYFHRNFAIPPEELDTPKPEPK